MKEEKKDESKSFPLATQMSANIDAYAESFELCLTQATNIVLKQPGGARKDLDRQEIAEILFQRFWDDQQAELNRKFDKQRTGAINAVAGTLQQMRGGVQL